MSHRARKRFGQNFLTDANVIAEIIAAINPQACDNMVEIGPGLGAITKPLLETLNHLNVIEIDRDLIPQLNTYNNIQVYEHDALQFDFTALTENNRPLRVVGNLPYNISTPLLFHLLDYAEHIQDMFFMLQNEVVDRICAEPNSKQYGRLSIMMQYYCDVEKCFTVSPKSFNPAPKVDSAIIHITPKQEKMNPVIDEVFFSELVRISFHHRRKTLRNNLKVLLSSEQLDSLSIDLRLRPEDLSVASFVTLCNEAHRGEL